MHTQLYYKHWSDQHVYSKFKISVTILSFYERIIVYYLTLPHNTVNSTKNKFVSSFLHQPPTLINDNPTIKRLAENFGEKLEHIKDNGPTAQLWIQYFKMVPLVEKYIHSERFGMRTWTVWKRWYCSNSLRLEISPTQIPVQSCTSRIWRIYHPISGGFSIWEHMSTWAPWSYEIRIRGRQNTRIISL